MKNIKLSNKKDGFTLVEVIVTLVITVIVVAVSSSLVITGTNIFARNVQRDIQTNIAETALTFVSDQLLYANRIGDLSVNANGDIYEALSAINASGAAIIHIKKNGLGDTRGELFFRRAGDTQDPLNIFGSNFYQGYEIGIDYKITISSVTGPSLTLTVTVYRNNSAVTSRSTTKPLLNYEGGAIEITNSPNFIYFTVPTFN